MKRHVYILGVLLFLITSFSFTIGAEEVKSLKELKKRVKDEPENGDAWVVLGFGYLEDGQVKEAKGAFEKGVQYGKSAAAYTGLGIVYTRMGKGLGQKAFRTFRMALGVDPNYVDAYMEIARLHVKMGEADAEAAFKRVIAIDSTYAPAYLEFMNWHADQDYY